MLQGIASFVLILCFFLKKRNVFGKIFPPLKFDCFIKIVRLVLDLDADDYVCGSVIYITRAKTLQPIAKTLQPIKA